MLTRRSLLGALPSMYVPAKTESFASDYPLNNREYHVSTDGDDTNDGTRSGMLRPLRCLRNRKNTPSQLCSMHQVQMGRQLRSSCATRHPS